MRAPRVPLSRGPLVLFLTIFPPGAATGTFLSPVPLSAPFSFGLSARFRGLIQSSPAELTLYGDVLELHVFNIILCLNRRP